MTSALRTAVLVLAVLGLARAGAAAECETLTSTALPNAKVDSAQVIAAGAFTPPGARGGAGASPYAMVPAFCRVQATLTPSADSDVKIEVWLPVAGWNGNFQGVGNRGWGGTIMYPALAAAVSSGYATASTDTGHTGNNA